MFKRSISGIVGCLLSGASVFGQTATRPAFVPATAPAPVTQTESSDNANGAKGTGLEGMKAIDLDRLTGPGVGEIGPIPADLVSPVQIPSTTGVPETAATSPAKAAKAAEPAVSTDKLFTANAERFRRGEYRECMTELRDAARTEKLSPEAHQLYVASLVATGQMSSAAFQAVEGAKANPKTFFEAAKYMASVYQDQPDFKTHFEAVRKVGQNARTLEPGILWALYQKIEGEDEHAPVVTISLLRPGNADKGWFSTLRIPLSHSVEP